MKTCQRQVGNLHTWYHVNVNTVGKADLTGTSSLEHDRTRLAWLLPGQSIALLQRQKEVVVTVSKIHKPRIKTASRCQAYLITYEMTIVLYVCPSLRSETVRIYCDDHFLGPLSPVCLGDSLCPEQ